MKRIQSDAKLEGVGLIAAIVMMASLMVAPATLWAQFGRITGRVVEAETGDELPGANVFLRNTSLGAATDASGRYLITRVPVGTYTLEVRYLGFEPQSAEIKIESGVTLSHDFRLTEQVLVGEEVVVLGIRAKGQARALNQQMNASNIKNIVASDQMGRFPDANAPEALQRIPGIHIQRDMGEGRYVQIRGGSPAMTSVTFNGERVPSPEGDVRQIALDAVPTEILESIDVSKAITPDMDADAIGGSVNLVTKRAPEGGMLSIEGAPGYGSLREDVSGKGSLSWGARTADGKLGLLLSGSLGKRYFGADDLEPEYEFNGLGLRDDILTELQVRHYTLSRERRGVTGLLDYRLNDNSTLYFNAVWTELRDDENRRRLRHRIDKGDYQPDGSVTDGRLQYEHKDRLEILRSWNFSAGGEHLLGNSQLDYHFTVTQSEEDTPRDIELKFVQKKVDFRPDIFSDFSGPQPNPEAGTIAGTYKLDSYEPASSITSNRDIVAALNFTVPYRLGDHSVGKIKLGGKFRKKDKDQDVTENVFEVASGFDDIILGQDIGEPFSNAGYNPGNYPFPPFVPTVDEDRDFEDKFGSRLEGGHSIADDAEDFEAEEKTFAFYGMTEINFTSKFMMLAGARFERTELENTGYEFNANTETLTPRKGSGSYNRVFPMVHARLRLTPRTNLRAAVTTALLRPNFYDLAPFHITEDEDELFGNPELDPATSVNLDLMFEHYFRPVGLVSAGVFYKKITDPIFRFTERNARGGKSTQPRNGEDARVAGFEVALQQHGFLPKPLDGIGIYGNYTFTSSETTLPDGRKADLAGQAKHVFNAALSYEKGPFSSQLSLNFNDDFVDEFGGDIGGGVAETFTDIYVKHHLQLDLSGTFRLTPNFSLFLEWVNLTNEPWELYQVAEERPIQREFYESWAWFGIKFNR